jgi:hypothetical protein
MNPTIIEAAANEIRRTGGIPTTVYMGAKQRVAWDEWKRVHYLMGQDANRTTIEQAVGTKKETWEGLEIVSVGKYDYFEVTAMGLVASLRQQEATKRAEEGLEAERADHAVTRAALAHALDDIDALATGQTDLINLLMACLAQGEALPESLRVDIAKLFQGAVVVETLPSGTLMTQPLSGATDDAPPM